MKPHKHDELLQSIFDFSAEDLELNREDLFSYRQKEFFYARFKMSNKAFYVVTVFMILWAGIIVLFVALAGASTGTFSGSDTVGILLVVLLMLLVSSVVWRATAAYNYQELFIKRGVASVKGTLCLIEKPSTPEGYMLQIGDRQFTVRESALKEIERLVQSAGTDYYRAYYSRSFSDQLLSLERLSGLTEYPL